MHLIGRWEKVRGLGAHGWGLPYLLDTKWRRLLPYRRDEWWRAPDGRWVPTIRGGALSYGQILSVTLGILDINPGISLTTVALSSAYTAGSAGAAIGWRFTPPDSLTLSKVAFWIGTFSGTAANVDDLDLEVRPQDASNARPDTGTLIGSAVMDPAAATGWNSFSGLSIGLASGIYQWIVIADADGNGIDIARVAKINSIGPPFKQLNAQLRASDTTNGYTTAPTISNAVPVLVLVFSDGTVMGFPFTSRTNQTNDALQKGWHFSTGLPFNARVYGAYAQASGNYSGVRIWTGTSGPSGTPYAESTAVVGDQGDSRAGAIFTRPFPVITRGQQHRLVFTYGASANVPHLYNCGTGADGDIKKSMLGGGEWVNTNDVAGAWVDTDSAQPGMNVLLDDIFPDGVAIALSVSDGLR